MVPTDVFVITGHTICYLFVLVAPNGNLHVKPDEVFSEDCFCLTEQRAR